MKFGVTTPRGLARLGQGSCRRVGSSARSPPSAPLAAARPAQTAAAPAQRRQVQHQDHGRRAIVRIQRPMDRLTAPAARLAARKNGSSCAEMA